jgi:hypothetical protein
MRMIIENIKWPFAPEEKIVADVAAIIRSRLLKLNLTVRDYVDGDSIFYDAVETTGGKGRLFVSSVKNIRPLSDNDPRVTKLGRNYLDSTYLTKIQWDGIVNTFTEVFSGLKLHADIKLQEFKDDPASLVYLRQGDINFDRWPTPNKFTMPKGSL